MQVTSSHMAYTEKDSKVENLARRLRKFFVWRERPLCEHKARVKTTNLLHSQRSQKSTFESFSVYTNFKEEVSTRVKKRAHRGLKSVFAQSWWVVLFCAVCGLVYGNAVAKKQGVIASLDRQFEVLLSEKASLLQKNEDLRLQVQSQSDPAWIQLTLMKGLGLVPEGQLKVYFFSEED